MPGSLQVTDERKQNRTMARNKARPDVSVVLVCDGSWQTMESSLARVTPRCRRMLAEIIVMSTGDDTPPAALQSAHPEVRFCCAPAGSSETHLRSVAMLEAAGDIVALRRASECQDALWLDAHFRVATGLDPHDFDAIERATYDGIVDVAVDAEPLVELPQTAARRTARHVDASPASSASSAA